jgi:circadian clock protein KaiC
MLESIPRGRVGDAPRDTFPCGGTIMSAKSVMPHNSTGVAGLDDILGGGLTGGQLFLVEGDPGSGKTTLALQFLRAGVAAGEKCLFISLSETEAELRENSASHGWTLEGIDLLEIAASADTLEPSSRYTMYHPSEVELGETTKTVIAEVQRLKPTRVVLDSLSELRLLAENPLRYSRQVLALKQQFSRQGATIMFCDDRIGQDHDERLHSIAHGVLVFERRSPEYGASRRRLQVTKLRGRSYREGYHDYAIRRHGLEVFPRLVAAEHVIEYERQPVKSDLPALDALLGGGLSRGTSTLILGSAGTGKSSVATHFAMASAKRGERAAMFLFDETMATFLERSKGLGFDVEQFLRNDRLAIRQIDPAELSPGEFAIHIRNAVEEGGSKLIVIDSLNGYLNAMPSDRYLALHLHELLTYLGQLGATTIMLMAEHGLLVDGVRSPLEASYIADTVMLVRYYENHGEIRRALSVIKKRTGAHENTIRELRFDHGLVIGEPIRDVRGALSGLATPMHAVSGDGRDP